MDILLDYIEFVHLGHAPVIDLLIKSGANVNAVNEAGQKPLDLHLQSNPEVTV